MSRLTWPLRNIKLFRNWYGIYLARQFPELKLRNGLSIKVNSKHDIPILWEVIGERCYNGFTSKEQIIVDIGANVGAYTLLALKETNAHVYAYEPNTANFELLRHNVAANGYNDRTTLYKKAIAEESGQKPLFLSYGGDSGHHSLKKHADTSDETEAVSCVTLDDVINEAGGIIDIVKVDVEGMEEEILRSCTQLHRIKRIEVESFYRDTVKILKGNT